MERDIKPLAYIEMYKKSKEKVKKLEEENRRILEENKQLKVKLERSEIKFKLLDDENRDLKSKLLNTTVEMQQYKRVCENNSNEPQQEDEEGPTYEIQDSDEEMDTEMSNHLQEIPEINHNQTRPKFFQCNLCPKSYLQEKRLFTHIEKHRQGSQSVPVSVQRGRKCTIQYTCQEPGCNFTCPYKPAFNRHVNCHRLPTYECPIEGCNYKSPYEKRIRNHMETKHRTYNETFPDGNDMSQFDMQINESYVDMSQSKINMNQSYN